MTAHGAARHPAPHAKPTPEPAPERGPTAGPDVTAHLTPDLWARATRHLIRKALAEFAHERLLQPAGPGPYYEIGSDDGHTRYRFRAERLALDHWHIDPASISRHRPATPHAPDGRNTPQAPANAADPDGPDSPAHPEAPAGPDVTTAPDTPLPLDALAFFTELRETLGLSDEVLPVYLEEITATLACLAYKFAAQAPSARHPHGVRSTDLAAAPHTNPPTDQDTNRATDPPTGSPTATALDPHATATPFQAVEAAMTEGHPCFVANSGRIGFGASDLAAYAPEAAAPVRLTWLAARRDRARFSAGAGLDYAGLIAGELDRATRDRFDAGLRRRGLDPADYLLIPAHPWQWEHRLAVTFAGEVAQQHLVHLGPGDDTYRAQQSIRTFFNSDRPERHYVKTALSVLNMGFLRGLSAAYMEATPAINDWLAELIAADPTFTGARFSIIRERAAVGYHPLPYEAATEPGSPYRKMLAALWRESPVRGLAPGESLATMASLLHVDADGGSFAAALIARSGQPPARWLRGYLDAYLVPVVHSLFRHDLVYMPHGENVILVLGPDGGVARAVFKDIAEEIAVLDPAAVLPAPVERIRVAVPEQERVLSVFTDVFDCFLRFLSAILHTGKVLDEADFWATVRACVADYQRARPELAERFRRYDLFAPRFPLSCLNRLQLRDNRQLLDLADPSSSLQFAGTLANPIADPAPTPAPPPAPLKTTSAP